MAKAVVLLSGGLDSATTLAIARKEGYEIYTMGIDYGQRHGIELSRSAKISEAMGAVEHKLIHVNLRAIGGSALTDDINVPKAQPGDEVPEGIPVTYVPARNTVFLSLALAYAEKIGAADIFIGVNALDYSGYPDCRPEYITAFEKMARLATKAGVTGALNMKIHTPLIAMSKKEIIKTGAKLGVDFALTISCYDPDREGNPCLQCDACRIRAKGFVEAGIKDPAMKPVD